jgi:signal transduction histidine kinase
MKKLGRIITISNIVAFTAVILVGGISIFLAKDILHNGYMIKEESKNIAFINELYSHSYRLIVAMHHFLIDPDELYSQESLDEILEIEKKTADYKVKEENDLHPAKADELKLVEAILTDIEGLKGVTVVFEEFSKTGRLDKDKLVELEEFAYHIESTVKDINTIHFDKIAKWQEESLSSMWKIMILYIFFITFGGLSIYLGHRLLTKKVVKPIKELASATIDFSEGTFDKRVHTNSKTEIGSLYQSFNKMAGRIQENNELLNRFNEELEKKVQERTFELQNTNEQLYNTQKALIRTAKMAAIGQIAAGVAHEIKNPLNSLSLNTQLLLREVAQKFGSESEFYETASSIKFEINRINNILEEFVRFAKFPEPKLSQNNVNRIIKEVAEVLLQNAKNAGITLQLSLQDDIPEFNLDETQFKTVLMNLSLNAFNAMHQGSMFEIKTELRKGNVILYISDTGEGISQKNLEKIFTPFFSTRERGLGLGLSIVQRIIENHGGSITCTSEVGKGTVFEIVFPIERS